MDEEEDGSVQRLLQAAGRGDVNECVALIAEGVSPSACVRGTTPLHEAARRGHHSVLQLLLQHRANTQVRDYNDLTPLEVHYKRYNWFGRTLVHLTAASSEAYQALVGRTHEEREAANEAACASWRADNPQEVQKFDGALETLEEQMERHEITEGHYIERMNALRDEYNQLRKW